MGSITALLSALGQGDAEALEIVFEHAFPRLVALARKHLQGRPTAMADAEDAALSAMASLWRKADVDGLAPLLSRNELWALLATITIRKAQRQVRRERAAKRGGGIRFNEADRLSDREAGFLDQVAAQATSEMDLCCEERLAALEDEERRIALLRLAGWKDREIAEHLGCTQRKVERKLNLIRQRWAVE